MLPRTQAAGGAGSGARVFARDRDSLVAVASLAAAFLHESSDELATVLAATTPAPGSGPGAPLLLLLSAPIPIPASVPMQLQQHPG